MQRPQTKAERRRAHDDFWNYALRVYHRTGVETACLTLQDRCNVVVNQLLFCCWAAGYGYGRLAPAEIHTAAQAAGAWEHRVVAPLRAVRRQLKLQPCGVDSKACEQLRRQVKRSELSSERLAQHLLVDSLKRAPGHRRCRADIERNVMRYLELRGAQVCAEEEGELQVILQAAAEEFEKSA